MNPGRLWKPPRGRDTPTDWVNISDEERKEREAEALVERVKNSFSRDLRFKFVKLLGTNMGITMLVTDTIEDRKYVVKMGAGPSEQGWLNNFQWSEHISRIVAINNNPLNTLGVPFFMTEYMEHGTLRQFQDRTRRANEVLPNRLLWSIFLCLVRACIGMAWPPDGPPVQLEVTRPHDPLSVAHNDMHADNAVFGNISGPKFITKGNELYLSEHFFVPILKLIDFGMSTELRGIDRKPISSTILKTLSSTLKNPAVPDRRNRGIDKNLLDVGLTMGRTISRRGIGIAADIREWMRQPDVHPSLDPDLRLLVQRCLDADAANRPRLDELMVLINNNTFVKGARDYGDAGKGNGLESDATLKRLVSTYILDADTE